MRNQSMKLESHQPATRVKRPYVAPAFRSESVFETMALSCGKINGTQGPCGQVKKLS